MAFYWLYVSSQNGNGKYFCPPPPPNGKRPYFVSICVHPLASGPGQSLPCQGRWWASYCCYEPLPTQWWGGNIFWKTQCTTLLQKIIQLMVKWDICVIINMKWILRKHHHASLSQGQYWLPDLLRWDIQTLLRNLLENLQCMQLFSVANEDVRPTQRRVTIYSSPICSHNKMAPSPGHFVLHLCYFFCTLKAKSCSSASPGAAVGLHSATFPSPLIGSNDPHYCSSNRFIIQQALHPSTHYPPLYCRFDSTQTMSSLSRPHSRNHLILCWALISLHGNSIWDQVDAFWI